MEKQIDKRSHSLRKGFIGRMILPVVLLIALLLVAGYFVWAGISMGTQESPPLMTKAERKMFIHEIITQGNVDSERALEIQVEVESAGELTILSIIPEGTIVKEGDLLVELNSATLLESVTKQQLEVNKSEAALVKAMADLKTAELTMKEYLEGKYPESVRTIQTKMFTAEDSMRMAEEERNYNVRLLQRGYITESRAEADNTAYQKAKIDYEAAVKELEVLVKYTRLKTIVQNQTAIESAKASLKSAEEILRLDRQRLEHLQKQFDNCTIRSPGNGQVVYITNRWEETVLTEGTKVYGRQKLIKLPDISKMQVKGLVTESNIRLVKPDQKVSIELEAFPNEVFEGIVKSVNDYPEQGWGGNNTMAREYETSITILNPPPGIKSGLTAKVKITVNEIENALQVPIQSVFEHGGKIYAITYNNGMWDKLELKTGPTNDMMVVIEEGLHNGNEIVLGAWQYRNKVDLPKLEEDETDGESSGEGEKRPKKPIVSPNE